MAKVLYVGLGGFIGSIFRYLLALYAPRLFGTHLPFGTLAVNVLGGLLIGFIMELSQLHTNFSPELRLFLTTGIMGGFTTFSTFSYETVNLFSAGSYTAGILNVCLNLFLSLGGVVLGKYISRLLFGL